MITLFPACGLALISLGGVTRRTASFFSKTVLLSVLSFFFLFPSSCSTSTFSTVLYLVSDSLPHCNVKQENVFHPPALSNSLKHHPFASSVSVKTAKVRPLRRELSRRYKQQTRPYTYSRELSHDRKRYTKSSMKALSVSNSSYDDSLRISALSKALEIRLYTCRSEVRPIAPGLPAESTCDLLSQASRSRSEQDPPTSETETQVRYCTLQEIRKTSEEGCVLYDVVSHATHRDCTRRRP